MNEQRTYVATPMPTAVIQGSAWLLLALPIGLYAFFACLRISQQAVNPLFVVITVASVWVTFMCGKFSFQHFQSLIPRDATVEHKTYFLLSGEGEQGTWETVEATDQGIRQRLTRERCNGDRWARAFSDVYELQDGDHVAYDIDTGERHAIPTELLTS